MKRQDKYMTSRAALLLQALAQATFGKQLHNSQNCICDDQQGREQLLEQVLDRTSLQILLIHPQVCVTTIKMSKENMKIWQAVFFLSCFQRARRSRKLQGK